LNGTNTYTGGTFINAGTLALGAGASLHASGIVNLATGRPSICRRAAARSSSVP
jgi:hypothetical protein